MSSPSSAAWRDAARAAAGAQQFPAATLYVVATPIGNLADLSLRALHVLGLVDAVACEDTRVTGGLLRLLGLSKPLLALHEHNEQAAAGQVNKGQGGAGIGLSLVYRTSQTLQVDVEPGTRTRVTAVMELTRKVMTRSDWLAAG